MAISGRLRLSGRGRAEVAMLFAGHGDASEWDCAITGSACATGGPGRSRPAAGCSMSAPTVGSRRSESGPGLRAPGLPSIDPFESRNGCGSRSQAQQPASSLRSRSTGFSEKAPSRALSDPKPTATTPTNAQMDASRRIGRLPFVRLPGRGAEHVRAQVCQARSTNRRITLHGRPPEAAKRRSRDLSATGRDTRSDAASRCGCG